MTRMPPVICSTSLEIDLLWLRDLYDDAVFVYCHHLFLDVGIFSPANPKDSLASFPDYI